MKYLQTKDCIPDRMMSDSGWQSAPVREEARTQPCLVAILFRTDLGRTARPTWLDAKPGIPVGNVLLLYPQELLARCSSVMADVARTTKTAHASQICLIHPLGFYFIQRPLLPSASCRTLLRLALDRLALHLLSSVPRLVRHLLARSTDRTVLLECLAYGTALLCGKGTTDYRYRNVTQVS